MVNGTVIKSLLYCKHSVSIVGLVRNMSASKNNTYGVDTSFDPLSLPCAGYPPSITSMFNEYLKSDCSFHKHHKDSSSFDTSAIIIFVPAMLDCLDML